MVSYIKSHGHEVYVNGNRLGVLDVWIFNGEVHQEWIEIDADWDVIRDWLGY